MRRLVVLVGFLMSLSLAVAADAIGQTVTGTIQGTVLDATEATLPGVTIVAVGVDTGQTREVVSNERGYFNIPFLPLGRYRVTASRTGFGTVVRENRGQLQVGPPRDR